jgi:hypothetical protein
MTEKDQAKQFIIAKFGGLKKFCRIAKYDPYELQKLFHRKEPAAHKLRGLMILAKKTTGSDPNDLSDGDREKLRDKIQKFGGVSKFRVKHPEFRSRIIYKILSGGIRRLSPTVKKLLKTLRITK